MKQKKLLFQAFWLCMQYGIHIEISIHLGVR